MERREWSETMCVFHMAASVCSTRFNFHKNENILRYFESAERKEKRKKKMSENKK